MYDYMVRAKKCHHILRLDDNNNIPGAMGTSEELPSLYQQDSQRAALRYQHSFQIEMEEVEIKARAILFFLMRHNSDVVVGKLGRNIETGAPDLRQDDEARHSNQ